MGLETELEFRKGRGQGFSPNTVLPSPRHCLDAEKRNVKAKGKPARKDNRLSLKEDFREISFGRYRSSSCKNVPSRPLVGLEGNIQLRRGSIYQSSREVGSIKKRGSVEGRRKIEVPCSSNGALSFRVVDTLCSSDDESQQERSSVMSQNSNFSAASVSRPYLEPCSSDDFFEICLDSSSQEKNSPGNQIVERTTSLHKSLVANVGMSRLPSLTENDCSFKGGSKARFSPIRKMFMKPKPVQSHLSDMVDVSKVKGSEIANNKTNKTMCKSLLDDFSISPDLEVNNPQIARRDSQQSLVAGSPVHLHGRLKLENKDGMPYFEFSLKCPEEVLVAKTWKADKALNWIYTFHSIDGRKRSNVSSRGSNYSNKESLIVGQMHVSCSVCSELRDERALDNSMVTEFVSYDIAHARKSVAAVQDLSNCSPDVNKSGKGLMGRFALGNEPDLAKVNPQPKHVTDNRELDSSYHCPWDPSDLHPNLEIAATVIQVPFEKRESLKYKRGDKICDKIQSNLLKLSKIEPKARVADNSSPAKVKVIIPSGNHGLPSDESQGPSSLLERWRLGGGCDCGGWDMACPLVVFGNPKLRSGEDSLLVENQHPLELFVQGSKENAPALTLRYVEEGEYAVDFHAQLSTLQAFSICVAILHSTEASAAGQERNMQLPQSSPLKILMDEQVKFLIEAVTEEEKRKLSKARKEIPASFVLNPPFSPIARV